MIGSDNGFVLVGQQVLIPVMTEIYHGVSRPHTINSLRLSDVFMTVKLAIIDSDIEFLLD